LNKQSDGHLQKYRVKYRLLGVAQLRRLPLISRKVVARKLSILGIEGVQE